MTATVTAQVDATFEEHPILFPAGGHELFGILSTPVTAVPRGIGVILTTGGSFIPAPNRNRLSVHLARRLAGAGFHAFRFDYHGVGESHGEIESYWLDRPFVEDLQGAIRCLEERGLRSFILIGSCFGARTILATAEQVPGLVGVVLASTPVRDFQRGDKLPSRFAADMSVWQLARRGMRSQALASLVRPQNRESFLRARRLVTRTVLLKTRLVLERLVGRPGRSVQDGEDAWVSGPFLASLTGLTERRIPLLLLYGTEEHFYHEFVRARAGRLGALLEAAADSMSLHLIEGVLHGFTSLGVQEAVVARTEAWVQETFRPASGSGR
jgi:pimeloyl-ACP methyl ester carboxylesterase